jgi:hypothetical protein
MHTSWNVVRLPAAFAPPVLPFGRGSKTLLPFAPPCRVTKGSPLLPLLPHLEVPHA